MAMMDNRDFLISHIRNSFITSDDTGMCELIIDAVDHTEQSPSRSKQPEWASQENSDSGLDTDTELAHSYDIIPDMDFSGHRRRSNTAQRLEKLKRDKRKQSEIKCIKWRDVEYIAEEAQEHFEKKELPPVEDNKEKKRPRSALSLQLEKSGPSATNPFSEYIKFDGRSSVGIPTKKIDIFLTMANARSRPYPMTVITTATGRVQDLIGLICCQYTMESRPPPLKDTVEIYSLHIAEDDGEVDTDFPALDKREPISKFGFGKLALVEKPPLSPTLKQDSVVITINLPSRGFSKFPVEDQSILMNDILDGVLRRRRLKKMKGIEYMFEKQHEPGKAIDLDQSLGAMDTTEFCLVRANSVRGDVEVEEEPSSLSDISESLSSHQYKSYVVHMSNKLWTNTEVLLGISGEKIEIDPVAGKQHVLFKSKATTFPMDCIAACTVMDQKATGRASFRLVYKAEHDFRHHDFECEAAKAQEISIKVNNILEMRSSVVRREYLAHKEKKLHRRHTLHL